MPIARTMRKSPRLSLLRFVSCFSLVVSLRHCSGATILHGEYKGDRLGSSLALSGDGSLLVSGYPVRVFVQDKRDSWSLAQQLSDNDASSFASTSVAISHDGTVVAVGSPKHDHKGQVQVYSRDPGTQQYTPLGPSLHGANQDDFFGCSLALSANGTILAVGARLSDESGATNAGHVQVYERTSIDDDWKPRGRSLLGEAAYDGSGFALSLSSDGSVVAVGAPANREYRGYVRIYEWRANDWHQRGETLRGEDPQELFGWSVQVSADGTICVVGAPHHDGNGTNAGRTRVFRWRQEGVWARMGQDIQGKHEHEQSGQAVALSSDGTKLAISSLDHNNSKSNEGYIQLFHWQNDAWVHTSNDLIGAADGDRFGLALAFSADGKKIAGGARRTDRSNVGHIRITSVRGEDFEANAPKVQ